MYKFDKYFLSGDKFCADIDGHDANIKSLEQTVERQKKQISDNSDALKGITTDSIVKLKDVANNCVQVEMNIRSIRDKSILFDNDLKKIKDQIIEIQQENKNNVPQPQQQYSDQQSIFKEKDDEIRVLNDGIKNLKKKVQTNSLEINNMREDKRTKEAENEERQLSLEQNLSDVRGWVETMLNESNKQLSDISQEVENANLKIGKCVTDIGDVLQQQTVKNGDFSFGIRSLEDKVKEVQEIAGIQQRELMDKILDIRGCFVDNQTEFVEKLKLSNEVVGSLRVDTNSKIEKLENIFNKKFDVAKTKSSPDINECAKKLDNLKTEHERTISEMRKGIEESSENRRKVNAEIACLQTAKEHQQTTLQNLNEKLASCCSKDKENESKYLELKTDLDKISQKENTQQKDYNDRMENMRKNLVEMVGLSEMKISEIDTILKQTNSKLENLKLRQSNIEKNVDNQMKATGDIINDSFKAKTSSDIDSKLIALQKDVDHIKNEIKIGDLESFKSVVNNTNETHNKLINALQKSLDLIICEKTILESQSAVLDSKLSDVVAEKETFEKSIRNSIKLQCDESEIVKDQMKNVTLSLRDILGKLETITNLETKFKVIENAKKSLENKVNENTIQTKNLQNMFQSENNNLKETVNSYSESVENKIRKEVNDLVKPLKEKSLKTAMKLNEATEMAHNHTKVIDNLSESLGQVRKSYEASDSQIQKIELKLVTCIEELSKFDNFVSIADFKKVERSMNDKSSDKISVSEINKNIETLKMDLSNQIKSMMNQNQRNEHSINEFQSKLENINDFTNFRDEVQSLSSKVNQQKAKMIDMDANITMQERTTTKILDDVKKISGKSSSMEKINSTTASDAVSVKMNEKDFEEFMDIKNKFNTKSSEWDHKVDTKEIEKMKIWFSEQTSKIENDIKKVSKNNDDLRTKCNNIKNSDENSKIFLQKEDFKPMEKKLYSLAEEFKSKIHVWDDKVNKSELEDLQKLVKEVLTSASDQGSKHANSQTQTKIAELEKSNEKIMNEMNKFGNKNTELYTKLSVLNEQFDKKLSILDDKADSEQFRNMYSFVNEELKKIRNDLKYSLDKQEELRATVNGAKDNNSDKEFDSKISTLQQKMKTVETLANNEINKIKENNLSVVSQIETKLLDLTKKNEETKVKYDSELCKLNMKVDKDQFTALDSLVKDEFKNIRCDIKNLMEKNDRNQHSHNTDSRKIENVQELAVDIESLKSKIAILDDYNKFENCMQDELGKIMKNMKLLEDKNVSLQSSMNNKSEMEKIDGKLTEQRIKLDNSLKETDQKLSKLTANIDIVQNNILPLKIFEAKQCIWDAKADSSDLSNMKNDLQKIKGEMEFTLDKVDTLSDKVNCSNAAEVTADIVKETETRLKETLNNLERKLTTVETSTVDFKKKFDSFNSSLDDMKKSAEAQSQQDLGRKINNDEMEKINNSVRQEIEKSNVEFKEKFDQLTTKIADIPNMSNESLTNEMEKKVNGQLTHIQNKLKNYDEEIVSTTRELENQNKLLHDISPKISELEKYNKTINAEMSDLNLNIQNQKAEVENLLFQNDELSSKINTLTVPKENETANKTVESRLTASMATVENKMAIFDAARKETAGKLTKLNEEISRISEIKSKVETKLSDLERKAEKDDVIKLEKQIYKEVEAFQKELENVSKNISERTEKEIETLSVKLKTILDGLNERKKQDDNSQSMKQFEEKLNIAEVNNDNMKNQISKILNEETNMKKEIQQLANLKSIFDSKSKAWDSKVDGPTLEKLEKSIEKQINESSAGNNVKYLIENLESKCVKKEDYDAKSKQWDSKANNCDLKRLEDKVQNEIYKTLKNDTDELINSWHTKFTQKEDFQNQQEKLQKIEVIIEKGINNESKTNDAQVSLISIDAKYLTKEAFENEKKVIKKDISKVNSEFDRLLTVERQYDMIESKMSTWDSKAGDLDIKRLTMLINEKVLELQKSLSTVSKIAETTSKQEIIDVKDFISKEEFTVLDINFSKLSEVVEQIQSEVCLQDQERKAHLEQLDTTINTVKSQVDSFKKDYKTTSGKKIILIRGVHAVKRTRWDCGGGGHSDNN